MRCAATVCLLALALAGAATGANADPYTFANVSAPGAGVSTYVGGLNNIGQAVGYTVAYPNGAFTSSTFVDTKGVFTTLSVPGVDNVSANAINDAGQVTGNYFNAGQYIPSQSYVEANGVFTPLNIPAGAEPFGINNAGEVVGSNGGGGFVYANGVFTAISAPGSSNSYTTVTGVNNAGQIVGYYQTSIDFGSYFQQIVDYHSFVDTNGLFTILDGPAGVTHSNGLGSYSQGIRATGINDAGEVVGNYVDGGNFVYANGMYSTIDLPATDSIEIGGVNDAGQISGLYIARIINSSEFSTSEYSVIATPATAVPEPASAALLGMGLAGLGLAVRRRARA